MAEFEDFDEFQEQLEGNDLAALQEEDFNDEFNDETFGGEISDDGLNAYSFFLFFF